MTIRPVARLAALGAVLLALACSSRPPESPGAAAPPRQGPPAEAEAGAWTQRAVAPTALTEVAAAAVDGEIWVAGGLDGRGQAVNAVSVYDPRADAWRAGPSLPEPVHHAALVSTGDAVYLLGGYVGSTFERPTSAVRRYNAAGKGAATAGTGGRGSTEGRWVETIALPGPRAAGAAAWDGRRIVYGGGVSLDGLAGEVFALDAGGDRWQGIGRLSPPREHLAAASDGRGRVWFLGGRLGPLQGNQAAADLVSGAGVESIGALPTPRGGVAAFWSPAVGACLAGGERPQATFVEVECIDAAGAVTVLPDLAEGRHGLGAAVVDGVAYALLGGPEPRLAVSGTVQALPLED